MGSAQIKLHHELRRKLWATLHVQLFPSQSIFELQHSFALPQSFSVTYRLFLVLYSAANELGIGQCTQVVKFYGWTMP
jgi:hypothetical protein